MGMEMEVLKEKVRKKTGISMFNEMQLEAFEFIPKGSDTFLISATGSGKTLAFLIPILSRINSSKQTTQALIISPTRELALQITNVLQTLGLGFNVLCCYGGHPVRTEKKALEGNPQIVVGTPGRILDHLDRNNLTATHIKHFVLDEFDKSLEMGFHKQMKGIINHFEEKPQYILTSATKIHEMPDFVRLDEPQTIHAESSESTAGLELFKINSPEKDKIEPLLKLIYSIGHQSTFVFCNYRESVERVSKYLTKHKIHNDFLHGGLDQIQRENVLSKFRNGSTRILITTDLAGRGLDIPHVENVVHYHFPITEEVYIHRNGRTARMGDTGSAFVIIFNGEEVPEYLSNVNNVYKLSDKTPTILPPEWITMHINKGRKDKISKGDVAGYLMKSGGIEKENIGLIELKNNYILVALKKNIYKKAVHNLEGKKIKGKKAYIKKL